MSLHEEEKGKLYFNKKRNTLEQDIYRYELQDVKKPNLFEDIFTYGEIPKIPFNHRIVPLNPPDDIWITDTTFRDGQQAHPPFSAKNIVDLYTFMHKLGGERGIIRASEFFLYSKKDKEAVRRCLEKGFKFPEVTGWIRAVREDFKLVKEMGLRETGILTSASDYHIFLKLKMTRRQAMDQYLGIVKAALDEGINPRCHLEDITRADIYGFVVPFVQELMKLARDAKRPIKVRACDTLGLGVTYPGAGLPRSVKGVVYSLTHYAGVPSEWLEWHGHNDFYLAVNNATTAWLYGSSAVNGTLLGIGERTGNTPIEALVIEYIALRSDLAGIDTTVITDIAKYFRDNIGYNIPHNQPFVGSDFNVTRAGIHADGLMKDDHIYNIFNTKKILKRASGVAITDKSGVAGVAKWINDHFKLKGKKQVAKDSPAVIKIKEWIDKEYATERTSSITTDEMLEQVHLYMPELIKK